MVDSAEKPSFSKLKLGMSLRNNNGRAGDSYRRVDCSVALLNPCTSFTYGYALLSGDAAANIFYIILK